jgi:hypothetical protein
MYYIQVSSTTGIVCVVVLSLTGQHVQSSCMLEKIGREIVIPHFSNFAFTNNSFDTSTHITKKNMFERS